MSYWVAFIYAHPTGSRLYLAMLAVNPVDQAQGVGKFLLRAAEAYGIEHGCTVSNDRYFRASQ